MKKETRTTAPPKTAKTARRDPKIASALIGKTVEVGQLPTVTSSGSVVWSVRDLLLARKNTK